MTKVPELIRRQTNFYAEQQFNMALQECPLQYKATYLQWKETGAQEIMLLFARITHIQHVLCKNSSYEIIGVNLQLSLKKNTSKID